MHYSVHLCLLLIFTQEVGDSQQPSQEKSDASFGNNTLIYWVVERSGVFTYRHLMALDNTETPPRTIHSTLDRDSISFAGLSQEGIALDNGRLAYWLDVNNQLCILDPYLDTAQSITDLPTETVTYKMHQALVPRPRLMDGKTGVSVVGGSALLFLGAAESGQSIYRIDLSNGAVEIVHPFPAVRIRSWDYSQANDTFYLSAAPDGRSTDLIRATSTAVGLDESTLTVPLDSIGRVTLSPMEDVLLVEQRDGTGTSSAGPSGIGMVFIEEDDRYQWIHKSAVGGAWRPSTGRQIAYVLGHEIWIYDAGREKKQLIFSLDGLGPKVSVPVFPVWSPDGDFLAVVMRDVLAGVWTLLIVRVDTQECSVLRANGPVSGVAWLGKSRAFSNGLRLE